MVECTHQPSPPPSGHSELPKLAAPKASGGLRSVTITWVPPSLTTAGVAVYQYNLYHMRGPASAFDQGRAQRLTVKPEATRFVLSGLEPTDEYSVALSYVVVKQGKPPSNWDPESPVSPATTVLSAPDAQSKRQQRQGL